jgi:hypothetical protein
VRNNTEGWAEPRAGGDQVRGPSSCVTLGKAQLLSGLNHSQENRGDRVTPNAESLSKMSKSLAFQDVCLHVVLNIRELSRAWWCTPVIPLGRWR